MKKIMSFFVIVFALAVSIINVSYAVVDKIGIVMLPAKGKPMNPKVEPYVRALRSEGYKVVVPEMPWSYLRFNDTYEGAINKIANILSEMQKNGIGKVFITGHSIGTNVAIGYAATRKDVDGILAVAPGHTPDWARFP